jgi:hypothetical protein
MSRIYFHSPSGEAEVLGAERAHLGILVNDTAERRVWHYARLYLDPVQKLTSRSHLQPDRPYFLGRFITAFRVRGDKLLTWRGREIDAFAMALNTAIDLDGEGMRLVARLEGQCEIHCYVEGENRAWLAGLIQDALDAGMLRHGMGWDAPPRNPYGKGGGVIPLLRSRADEPVVMSYSVEASFPYAAHVAMPPHPQEWIPEGWSTEGWAALSDDERAGYRDEGRSDAFDNLPETERWAFAMDWLRSRSETMGLELKPDDWGTFRFGHGLTVLDLEAPDWQARVEQALGLEPATP